MDSFHHGSLSSLARARFPDEKWRQRPPRRRSEAKVDWGPWSREGAAAAEEDEAVVREYRRREPEERENRAMVGAGAGVCEGLC